jgi:hypothetical protein
VIPYTLLDRFVLSVASSTLVGTTILVMVSPVTSAQISSSEPAQHTFKSASQDGKNREKQAAACTDTKITEYIEKLGTSSLTEAQFQAVVSCGVRSVSALTEALKHNQSEVRSSAAYALGQIGSDAYAAVPALITALEDEYLDVRTLAAYALGKIGARAEAAVPALGKVYRNPIEAQEVRNTATQALRQVGTEQALAVLSSPVEPIPLINPRGNEICWQNPRRLGCPLDQSRINSSQTRVAVKNRVSSNLPLICQLPAINTIFPRCR